MYRKALGLSVTALSVGLLATCACAAPPASLGHASNLGAMSVDQVASRCYRHHGQLRCSRFAQRGRYHGFGYRSGWHNEDPSHMRAGSRRWWNAKEREGSAGDP